MAKKEKLPWDLMEEILSHVPPTSLIRFKTVCKRWNTVFDNKTFINNHKKTVRFILTTKSKIYSVSINPKIEVRELTLNIPGLKSQIPKRLADSSGFLLCGIGKGVVIWNPRLRQTRCIDPEIEVNQPSLNLIGIGYDNNKRVKDEETVYKTLSIYKEFGSTNAWIIHNFSSDWLKDQAKYRTLSTSVTQGRRIMIDPTEGVSLNGTLYWVAYYDKTQPLLFIIVCFNFSSEKCFKFCDLPCVKNHQRDAIVLRVFGEDRFSLLKQCNVTKKINIWVTKNKINNWYGENVKWIKFMDVSIPNLQNIVQTKSYAEPSYFIDDKKLVICVLVMKLVGLGSMLWWEIS